MAQINSLFVLHRAYVLARRECNWVTVRVWRALSEVYILGVEGAEADESASVLVIAPHATIYETNLS